MTYQLHCGDCINIMPMIERDSVDAIVTDPPYGLGFMGKDWDHGVPGMHFWLEALRCAKPGAHLLAFGGTRTFHRLAVAIEDAGWEIRDTVMWVYGQGFPKSHDVSKAIDKEAGAEREVIGKRTDGRYAYDFQSTNNHMGQLNPRESNVEKIGEITQPATPLAAEWSGWGTALKPAWEPIIVARKPLVGTVAENVQRYGTGAINVDACRIETDWDTDPTKRGWQGGNDRNPREGRINFKTIGDRVAQPSELGRWPANLIHDGSAEVLAGFPMTTTNSIGKALNRHQFEKPSPSGYGGYKDYVYQTDNASTGSAARFFYCAKASKQDRDEGLEEFDEIEDETHAHGMKLERWPDGTLRERVTPKATRSNHHPTVKPTSLMRYLCKLVTPPNGVILDPFMGSGSTGKAAILEGFNFIGIELMQEYLEIAARRIEHACGKVGIVVDQPMLIESRRQVVDKPKQLILL